MQSVMGAGVLADAPLYYTNVSLVDEYSRQLALAETVRRTSRGSNAYRPTNSMRIVKPSSASNSPQAMMARRRTLMNDGNSAKRRQQALDQVLFQQMQCVPSPCDPFQEPAKRSARPVSWHPSSQLNPRSGVEMAYQAPQADYSHCLMPTPTPPSDADLCVGYPNYPPTPMAYSGHTSPISSFSPLTLPFAASSQTQTHPTYICGDVWNQPAAAAATTTTATAMATPHSSSGSPEAAEPFPSYNLQSSFNWDAFATNGFSSCTAPPTPDNFQPTIHPEPSVPAEEAIPYRPLEEAEEEGEILVGMGLYDAPDKTDTDPELDNYRTSTSHLLGTTFRKGAGLKLEEAWEPPTKEAEDDESEEDAEGEEQDDN